MAKTYDISQANLRTSIDTQDGDSREVIFNNDGTKMYEAGNSSNKIYQSSLSTPYNIDTASLEKSVSSQDSIPRGITFNNDGTKFYEIGSGSDRIYELDLSTPYDIGTGSLNDSIPSEDGSPQAIIFNNNGTKMYEIGSSSNKIYQSSLSTPYDIHTASLEKSVSATNSSPRGMTFNNNGTKMYEIDSDSDRIYELDLSTAYDIGTSSLNQSIPTQGPDPEGVTFNNNGSKMYEVGGNPDRIYESVISNERPQANSDTATTPHETPVTIDVLANDTDPDGDMLAIENIAAQPANGTAELSDFVSKEVTETQITTKTLQYTLNTTGSGTDSATVNVSSLDLSNATNVRVTVFAEGDYSTDNSNEYLESVSIDGTDILNGRIRTGQGTRGEVISNQDVTNLLQGKTSIQVSSQNDSGVNTGYGDYIEFNFTATVVEETTKTTQVGTTVTYTPNLGFSGADSFTYTVNDGQGGTDIGMVTVTVEKPAFSNPLAAFGGI